MLQRVVVSCSRRTAVSMSAGLPSSWATTTSINQIPELEHKTRQIISGTGTPWGLHRRHLSCFTSTRLRKAETLEDENEFMGKGDKVLRVKLSTTRLDGILKTGLQISKNKIEKAFYEDRIRLNGWRPRKKSQLLAEGDEIDIVRGSNRNNPAFLDVARVEVVQLGDEETLEGDEDDGSSDDEATPKLKAVLKRYKSLTIENYEDPWKGPTTENT